MNDRRVVSHRFPYLPLRIEVHGLTVEMLALLDTGFDGDVIVPTTLLPLDLPPDSPTRWRLGDGSTVTAPLYVGTVWVGATRVSNVGITLLGDEAVVGRGITDRFTVILDHGRQLIIEP